MINEKTHPQVNNLKPPKNIRPLDIYTGDPLWTPAYPESAISDKIDF